MLKRALMMGLAVGIGLTTLHSGTAEAGNWSYIRPPGMWWWFGSVNGCAKIGRVPNTDKKPALMQCTVEILDGVCLNPNGFNVLPGEAARKITVSEPIDEEDLSEKKKGVANVCLSIDPRCKLRNWTLFVEEFEATCTTQQCLGTDDPETEDVNEACNTIDLENPADTQVCHCGLPQGVDVDNAIPCVDPFDPEEVCTRYECTDVETGDACELQ